MDGWLPCRKPEQKPETMPQMTPTYTRHYIILRRGSDKIPLQTLRQKDEEYRRVTSTNNRRTAA